MTTFTARTDRHLVRASARSRRHVLLTLTAPKPRRKTSHRPPVNVALRPRPLRLHGRSEDRPRQVRRRARPPGARPQGPILYRHLRRRPASPWQWLTDITGTGKNAHAADIVVHYVPTAGGVAFGGYAICGDHGCPNILVRSDLPPSLDRDPYSPEYLGWVTLHEIGHALGLGHATNLLESTDLMGYGWPELGDPVLSQCDVDALAFVFAWAIAGTDPAPPTAGPFEC